MQTSVDVESLIERLHAAGYPADRGLGTALACAVTLPRTLLLEGDAGVGTTEAALTLGTVPCVDARRRHRGS
jgi:hypothetical protein